jgi:hypothetical protein
MMARTFKPRLIVSNDNPAPVDKAARRLKPSTFKLATVDGRNVSGPVSTGVTRRWLPVLARRLALGRVTGRRSTGDERM